MTQEKFGEPNRGDAAADAEKEVEFLATDTLDAFEKDMPQILNRAVGTTKVSTEEEIADWLTVKDDAPALAQRFQALASISSIGPDRARLELLRWDKRMREAAEKRMT